MFKNFLQIISTKNLLSVFFFLYLSPIQANDQKFKLTCDVETAVLKDHEEWKWNRKMTFDLELDIENKTLIKKNFTSYNDKISILKTNFKIVSVTKNGLVAVSEKVIDRFFGFPDVSTITLKNLSSDNFLFESNTPVGFTLTNNQQSSWEQYYFAIQHGECK